MPNQCISPTLAPRRAPGCGAGQCQAGQASGCAERWVEQTVERKGCAAMRGASRAGILVYEALISMQFAIGIYNEKRTH